jgi:DNA-binding transcriptional LysR family regulator
MARTNSYQLIGAPEIVDFLSIFHALRVADHGSFSRAARSLGTQQSAVSRRVRALEDELGVSLFERQPNGVRMTIAGHRFLNRTRSAFDEIDQAVANASSAGRGVAGALRIGLIQSVVGDQFEALLKEYRREHPDVAFEFVESSSTAQLGMLLQRRIDVALCLDGSATPECDMEKLWTGDVFAALAEAHPLAGCDVIDWEPLKDEHFILDRDALGTALDRLATDRISQAGGRISLEANDVSRAVMRLVALRFGVALVSDSSVSIGFPGVAFRPLHGEKQRLSYCAVWLPGYDNPALRRFLSLARSMASKGWEASP